MNVTFKVAETPRVYVERIDITGNTSTRDKVIRREFRLNEGDAFNAAKVKRSQDRIQSLGYFQDKFEIKQTEGSAPDRVVLGANVEEKPTGQLSLSGGYSSLERFVIQLAVSQNNFMGKGQSARRLGQLLALFEVDRGRVGRSLLPRQADPVRLPALSPRLQQLQLSSAPTGTRPTSRSAPAAGFALGFPLTEYWNFGGRYSLVKDRVELDKSTFYTDPDGTGPLPAVCDPLQGRPLSVRRNRLPSDLVARLFDPLRRYRRHPSDAAANGSLSARISPGSAATSAIFAPRAYATKYKGFGGGWVFSAHAEGGFIKPLAEIARRRARRDPPDRPLLRPAAARLRYSRHRAARSSACPIMPTARSRTDQGEITDALGGRAYYMGRLELEFPVSSGLKSLGLRPVGLRRRGSLWSITKPQLTDVVAICIPKTGTTGLTVFTSTQPIAASTTTAARRWGAIHSAPQASRNSFWAIRPSRAFRSASASTGFRRSGRLRLDLAKALLKQKGDDTKLFSFNVGTSF